MAQIVIEVPGMGPVLFSPVLAHALEPGDMIFDGAGVVSCVRETAQPVAGYVRIFDTRDIYHLRINALVLRAVGARASRGGAR